MLKASEHAVNFAYKNPCQQSWQGFEVNSEELAAAGSKALAAVHGTILTGQERHLSGLAALGAHSVMHLTGSAGGGTGGLAGHTASLAAAGLILETLLGIELLLACGENEFCAAVLANQRLVFVHGMEPP